MRQRNSCIPPSGPLSLRSEQQFLNDGCVQIPSKPQVEISEKKINFPKGPFTATSRKNLSLSASSACFSSQPQPSSIYQFGNFLFQKHHYLADKFGVWHVMCTSIPTSCRKHHPAEAQKRRFTCPRPFAHRKTSKIESATQTEMPRLNHRGTTRKMFIRRVSLTRRRITLNPKSGGSRIGISELLSRSSKAR